MSTVTVSLSHGPGPVTVLVGPGAVVTVTQSGPAIAGGLGATVTGARQARELRVSQPGLVGPAARVTIRLRPGLGPGSLALSDMAP